jgi:hypothetical protein
MLTTTGGARRLRRARISLSALAILLGVLTWTALRAPSAAASSGCAVNGTTATIALDHAAGDPPTSLSKDGSGNLLVDGSMCGNFSGGTPLSEIQLTVASGVPAQTVLLDQTGAGGVFPCSAPLAGTLRAIDAIQVLGATGESLSAGDTPGGSGVNLNSCSSVGTIGGVGSYDLIAGAGAVTLSAHGAAPAFSGALSVPATFTPSASSSDTLIGGATADTIDFSAVVATSLSTPLTINVSGAPVTVGAGVLANDAAAVGSVTDTFSTGGAEFTTFDGAGSGNTDFLAGSSSETFADPGGSFGDTIDFSRVATSQSTPLTVNMSGAASGGVANNTAHAGTVTDTLTTGGASFTFVAPQSGNTTFLPGSQSETFVGTGTPTDTLDFSGVPTSAIAPLVVNRSAVQINLTSSDTATAGSAIYTFTSSPAFTTFDAAASGYTRFVAGTRPDTFGAPAGAGTDTLDFSFASASSLTINLSGAPSGSIANDTAQLGAVSETFSPNIATFDGLTAGNTTFLAGPSGGHNFDGTGTGNTLDFSGVPTSAGAPLVVNLSGSLSGGVANNSASMGTVTDTFTGSTSFKAAATGYTTFLAGANSEMFAASGLSATDAIDFSAVATNPSTRLTINVSGAPSGGLANDTAAVGSVTDTFSTGGAAFTTFDGASNGNTVFLAGSSSETFADPGGGPGDTLDFSSAVTSASTPLTVNMSGAASGGVANDTAQVGAITDTFLTGGSRFTFVAPTSGHTTFLPGADGETFVGTGSPTDTLDFSGVSTGSSAPLVINRSGSQVGATLNDTATAGSVVYAFTGSSAFATFDAAASGYTRFVAGSRSDTFGAPAGTAGDTLDFSFVSASSLTINLSGAPSGSIANDTAQLGAVSETFSPNIATLDGLAAGNTTFLAGPSGGHNFNGSGIGNTLDLTAVPADATVTANGDSLADPGMVQSLSAGVGGATVDTFSDIQSYVGAPSSPTTVVDDVATGVAWSGTETVGASAYDTAAMSAIGALKPTGTVTYSRFANGSCTGAAPSTQQVTLSGGTVPSSLPTGPLAEGAYSFEADYSGDGSYRSSTSLCERFAIPAAPSASIAVPVANHTYALRRPVATSFSCTEGANGPGIKTCADNNAGSGTSGHLDTSTVGSHGYTVTATSSDGRTVTVTVRYIVAGIPSPTITSPANGAVYRKGQRVRAAYACAEGAGGSGITNTGCVGPVASGAAIETSVPGTHSFTVRATSTDGLTSALTVDYKVLSPRAMIAIKATAASVSAKGTFAVMLSCGRGSTGCAGSLTLKAKKRTIASARFVLRAGHVARLRLTLTKAGRRLLATASHQRLKAGAVATTKTNTARQSIALTGASRS